MCGCFLQAPLLDDPAEQLLAVSAFNDNGLDGLVSDALDASTVLRSDFFPGLGWMLTGTTSFAMLPNFAVSFCISQFPCCICLYPREMVALSRTVELWAELAPIWPDMYWDDWLRGPSIRKDREILRPEVPRTLHFGVHGEQQHAAALLHDQQNNFSCVCITGTSNNQFGDSLARIQLHSKNNAAVDWESFDVSVLRRAFYTQSFLAKVEAAKPVDPSVSTDLIGGEELLCIPYDGA
eukprot:SAG31_NODE_1332_length_8743_cov_20.800810_4_plen_237_part_00